MFLESVQVTQFRGLQNLDLSFNSSFKPKVFPISSENGGGKSTLLQLIFILLSCSTNSAKHQYVKNLLQVENLAEIAKQQFFVKLKVSDSTSANDLKFSILASNNDYYSSSFDSIMDVKNFEVAIESIERLTSILKVLGPQRLLNHSQSGIKIEMAKRQNRHIESLFEILLITGNVKDKKRIQTLLSNFKDNKLTNASFEWLKTKAQDLLDSKEDFRRGLQASHQEQSQLLGELDDTDSLYLMHINRDYVLVFHGHESYDYLKECIANKVYLASHVSQIALFLERRARQSIFDLNTGIYSSYDDGLNCASSDIDNFITLNRPDLTLLNQALIDARNNDFDIALSNSGNYGDQVKEILHSLNGFLNRKTSQYIKDKDISELWSLQFKDEVTGKVLFPEDLSHGELKKLGLFIWLSFSVSKGSLVLMDEVEIGLHPDWQYELPNDFASWSPNSQFLLATHSYELCNALTPAHVVEINSKLKG